MFCASVLFPSSILYFPSSLVAALRPCALALKKTFPLSFRPLRPLRPPRLVSRFPAFRFPLFQPLTKTLSHLAAAPAHAQHFGVRQACPRTPKIPVPSRPAAVHIIWLRPCAFAVPLDYYPSKFSQPAYMFCASAVFPSSILYFPSSLVAALRPLRPLRLVSRFPAFRFSPPSPAIFSHSPPSGKIFPPLALLMLSFSPGYVRKNTTGLYTYGFPDEPVDSARKGFFDFLRVSTAGTCNASNSGESTTVAEVPELCPGTELAPFFSNADADAATVSDAAAPRSRSSSSSSIPRKLLRICRRSWPAVWPRRPATSAKFCCSVSSFINRYGDPAGARGAACNSRAISATFRICCIVRADAGW